MVDPSKGMELDFNYKVLDYIDKLFTNYSSISSIKYRFCIKIGTLPEYVLNNLYKFKESKQTKNWTNKLVIH